MDEIYINVEHVKPVHLKPSTHQTGPRSSERRFHGAVVLCLGLLSVFLLAALIGFGVHHLHSARASAAELSNLTERVLVSDNKLSALTAERDLLNASLVQKTAEFDRLQSLSRQKKTCPAGWRMFSCTCYLLSSRSDSWENGRQDCRDRGADLVIIDSREEQEFLSNIVKQDAWIGLNDRDEEGSWKWPDETPLTLSFWSKSQPDNGGGDPRWGEEDCGQIQSGVRGVENWNDLRCDVSMHWICEKMP